MLIVFMFILTLNKIDLFPGHKIDLVTLSINKQTMYLI